MGREDHLKMTLVTFELIGTWLGQNFGSFGTKEFGLWLDNREQEQTETTLGVDKVNPIVWFRYSL